MGKEIVQSIPIHINCSTVYTHNLLKNLNWLKKLDDFFSVDFGISHNLTTVLNKWPKFDFWTENIHIF